MLLEKWPNFFIVGAPKAGTTSLYEYLKQIPGVYMSPVKEPNFFSQVPQGGFKIKDKKSYLNLFKGVKNEKAIGEASTTYLGTPATAKLLYESIPHAKIIIILRDPVEQFFSGHLMLEGQGFQKLSFHERIQNEIKKRNKKNQNKQPNGYSEQVMRYFETFGRNQVKVIIFEEFIENKRGTVEEVLRFLGVESSINNFEDKKHNPHEELQIPRDKISQHLLTSGLAGKIAKKIPLIPLSSSISFGEKILKKKQNKAKPSMSKDDREILVKFFEDDVTKLQIILGHKLPWKNFQNKL